MSKAKEVLRFYRDFCRGCPDEMVAAAALMTSPDGDPVAVIVAGYIGDLAAGEDGSGAAPKIRAAIGGHDRADFLRRS